MEKYAAHGGGFHSWAAASGTHPQGGKQIDERYSPEVEDEEYVRNKKEACSALRLIEQSWIPLCLMSRSVSFFFFLNFGGTLNTLTW